MNKEQELRLKETTSNLHKETGCALWGQFVERVDNGEVSEDTLHLVEQAFEHSMKSVVLFTEVTWERSYTEEMQRIMDRIDKIDKAFSV